MPSSTSSSDIPYRDVPHNNWALALALCVIIVVTGIAAWEWLARSMYHIPGSYSDPHTAMWAEERRKLDDPDNGVRLVLVGSSRMLWAADLDILEHELGTRPLQLALPGTSPALLLKDIVENTDFDGLILVGVTPFLFNRFNGRFFGDDALEWYAGVGPSRRAGHTIHRTLSEHFGFLDQAFGLFELIDRYVELPEREGADNLHENDWKLGDSFADRQTDMWPPVEIPGSFDNVQITNFWSGGLERESETPEQMAEKVASSVEFYAPLVEAFHARGGGIVFIRMPSRDRYLEHDLKTRHKELLWTPMIEGLGAPAINTMDHPMLSSELDIPEWSHLSRQSQDDFSRRIVPYVESAYAQFYGHSIDQLIGTGAPSEQGTTQ